MRAIRAAAETADRPALVRRHHTYTRDQADESIEHHIHLAMFAAAAGERVIFTQKLDHPDVIGFVECCPEDMTVNGLLFQRTTGNRWRLHTFGADAVPTELAAFTRAIEQAVGWATEDEIVRGDVP